MIKGITIRSKLLLTTLVTVVFLLVLSLFHLDASRQSGNLQSLLEDLELMVSRGA